MPEKRSATFYVEEDGSLYPKSKVQWMREGLKLFAGGQVVITYERPKRSLKQNAYYWGVVIEEVRQALLEAGHPLSSKAIHEHYKAKYLSAEGYTYTSRETGEVHEIVQTRSTTDLDSTEFSDYVERIRTDELVQQLGIYIPLPGEDKEFV